MGNAAAQAAAERRTERLIADFRAGKLPALARAISMVEGGRAGADELLRGLLLAEPRARRFGITGPPGAGKSSLVAALASRLRSRGERVAIVAVDPTSPFSGGALLGDRIRMNDLATDPGVFIRSMATRGSLGGLAAATREVVDLVDVFGFPNVLVETVGVGQTELEIASAADTVAVVLVPESGDGIQAMKAGLMEIADLFVVNKSDRIGADRLVREIRHALHLRTGRPALGGKGHHGVQLEPTRGETEVGSDRASPEPQPEPPVLKTSAGRDEGVDDFLEALLLHSRRLAGSGALGERRERRARSRIRDVVEQRMRTRARRALAAHPALDRWVAAVAAGRDTPYDVADRLLRTILEDGVENRGPAGGG